MADFVMQGLSNVAEMSSHMPSLPGEAQTWDCSARCRHFLHENSGTSESPARSRDTWTQ